MLEQFVRDLLTVLELEGSDLQDDAVPVADDRVRAAELTFFDSSTEAVAGTAGGPNLLDHFQHLVSEAPCPWFLCLFFYVKDRAKGS
jgi:hypothetical protein